MITDPLDVALQGGDDFELIFTARPRQGGRLRAVRRHLGDLPITRIGVVTRAPRACSSKTGRANGNSRRDTSTSGSRHLWNLHSCMRVTISQSMRRKLVVLVIAVVGFFFMYEAEMFDSRSAFWQSLAQSGPPRPGSQLPFAATAYCKGTTTASGVVARTGVAAADPTLLPVGSVVNVGAGDARYSGVYTVMDTGPRVQGRVLDLYMWSCHEALNFGRKEVAGHRAASGMGSHCELSKPGRSRLPTTRSRAANSSARSSSAGRHCAGGRVAGPEHVRRATSAIAEPAAAALEAPARASATVSSRRRSCFVDPPSPAGSKNRTRPTTVRRYTI